MCTNVLFCIKEQRPKAKKKKKTLMRGNSTFEGGGGVGRGVRDEFVLRMSVSVPWNMAYKYLFPSIQDQSTETDTRTRWAHTKVILSSKDNRDFANFLYVGMEAVSVQIH